MSTPANAITAGHQALGPSLREEIIAFYRQNQRFPTAEEIDVIKRTVSTRVEATIRSKVGCWEGFWSSQDKVIGVAGDDSTLFTAGEIRALSGKGRTVRQTPINGSEYSTQLVPTGRNSYSAVAVLREHRYVLHWSITVQPVRPAAEVGPVEQAGSKLEELDFSVAGLMEKLDAADDQLGTALQSEIEEKVRRARPALVRELQTAWAELATKLPDRENVSGV